MSDNSAPVTPTPIKTSKPSRLIHFMSIFSGVALFGFGIFFLINDHNYGSVQGLQNEKTPQQETVTNPYKVTYPGQAGKNAMQLLKEKAAVKTQTASFGEYVDEINGIKGGQDNKYWILYVDGQMSQVGADQVQTQNNQTIEWRFE